MRDLLKLRPRHQPLDSGKYDPVSPWFAPGTVIRPLSIWVTQPSPPAIAPAPFTEYKAEYRIQPAGQPSANKEVTGLTGQVPDWHELLQEAADAINAAEGTSLTRSAMRTALSPGGAYP